MLLGVDVGGTFTDAAVAWEGGIATAKAPTTPGDQSEGVIAAVTAALAAAGGGETSDVETFAHGMTVATNALLEGDAARTALVATEGFTDVVELGRQARADLYRLCAAHPPPLAPPDLRVAAPERTGPDGVLRALGADGADAVASRLAELEPEAVAVVLLHSYRHPEHERELGEAIAQRLPGVHVSLSHEVVGTFREYERAATTEIDAALSPLLSRYLRRLVERAAQAGLPEPSIMQSSGGLAAVGHAAGHAALTVLSGPAGGAAGAAYAAAAAGVPDVLGLDMGGTSCDVCVVDDGRVAETSERTIAGRTLALPSLDIHTVGAGGGSVAWRDAGGALRVGPRSAGAQPGPAGYGRGGTEPTVTDANLVLGYLPAGEELAGGVTLDLEAAESAVGALASELGLEPLECAAGIVRVAGTEMAQALRVITVERGVDPRDYALMPFGGAGPMHAAAIAEELGMRRIVCPRASGVLSALGLVVSERRRDAQRSVLLTGGDLTADAIATVTGELGDRARSELGDDAAELRCVYELRYAGQAFELAVTAGESPSPDGLRGAFGAAHEERFGFREDGGEVELVTVRVAAVAPGPDVDLANAGAEAPGETRRPARFGGSEHDTRILRGELPPGLALEGPLVWEGPEATLVVPPGWRGEVHATGAVLLERDEAAGG
jgi:N-methylhydantoinase A